MLNKNTNEVNSKTSVKTEIYDWLEVIASAVLVVILLFTFVFRVVTIVGESMTNTLLEGEKLIITNCFYTPKQGDIVVVSRNADNSPSAENSNENSVIPQLFLLHL